MRLHVTYNYRHHSRNPKHMHPHPYLGTTATHMKTCTYTHIQSPLCATNRSTHSACAQIHVPIRTPTHNRSPAHDNICIPALCYNFHFRPYPIPPSHTRTLTLKPTLTQLQLHPHSHNNTHTTSILSAYRVSIGRTRRR